MNTFVVVRHGQTTWNKTGQMQGWAPTPLSDKGWKQATNLGKYLNQTYDITKIYSSDLIRTRQTTESITNELNGMTNVHFEEDFRERDKGLFRGFTWEEIESIDEKYRPEHFDSNPITTAPPDGESYEDVYERVGRRWEELVDGIEEDDDDVLIVTHGGSLLCLIAYVEGADITTVREGLYPPNCSVTEVQVDGQNQQKIVQQNTVPDIVGQVKK